MRKDYNSTCEVENRIKARWERTKGFNERLGRRRKIIGQPTANAERRRKLEIVNRLVNENNWRGDLARSVKDVIDMDDCTQVYGDGSR